MRTYKIEIRETGREWGVGHETETRNNLVASATELSRTHRDANQHLTIKHKQAFCA